jgi:membrane fusion protein (multidrug efflux system)
MTRLRLPLLILSLSLAAACGHSGKDDSSAAAQATPTPALPSDVQEVAKVAQATPTPAGADAAAPGTAADPAQPTISEDDGAVVATGELVSPVSSEVAVRTPGRVGQVYVDAGQRVRRGQPLLTLETQYLALDLKRADAEVARARAAAADAERDFHRKEELLGKQSVSQAAYDRSKSAYDSMLAAVASAEASRDLSRQKLADAVLRSPLTGVVSERRTEVGERLGEASVAFVIVQTAPLKLRFRLPERYLSEVRRGQQVRATVDPYPGETFSGRVTVVDGVVDPATRTVAVETEFANADGRLSPGLFARVQLDLGSEKHS